MDIEQLSTTKVELLEAARRVLTASGYADLSTRKIAAEAGTQMSQIRYHFGSKEGLVLALYEYMTGQLVHRHEEMFADPDLSFARKWELSCDYLDQDIASGYVRVLQELIAAGWSNETIGAVIRETLGQWRKMHIALARDYCARHGTLGVFEAEDIAALVGTVFIGAEAYIMLGYDEREVPIRRALRRLGHVIAQLEAREG